MEPATFRRILVPIDFAAGSECLLRQAAALATTQVGRILPLHVTHPVCYTTDYGYGPVNRADPDEALLRRTQARLNKLVRRVVPALIAEEVRVRSGETTDEISAAATEWNADLIIVLAHQTPSSCLEPQRHTVDTLVRRVRCPVLVIHAACSPGYRREKPSIDDEHFPGAQAT